MNEEEYQNWRSQFVTSNNKSIQQALSIRTYATLLMKHYFAILLLLNSLLCYSQDTIKVHLLYGSKPKKQYKDTEYKWFGGRWGGHVGIEGDSNEILNFLPNGKFHVFAKKNNRHSKYALHSLKGFYSIFGGAPDSMKKTVFYIPVTPEQKIKFDSISSTYLAHTPYDYAFWGMRCGAASYEILGQLGIVKRYSYRKTYRKIIYPKKLSKRLFKLANSNNWSIDTGEGAHSRVWKVYREN